MISLPTKLMMGLNLFLEHIFESNIIMISILVILINIIIWKKYKSILIKVIGLFYSCSYYKVYRRKIKYFK